MTPVQQHGPATESLEASLYPLDSTDPTLPLNDLEALREIVGDAKIVALGEPTHGQREVFQLKHRMIAYLVQELGFTTFAIEASVAGCRPMSNFVRTGEGDPEAAVKAQGFWTWATEEVLELILWLREWDIAHPEHQVDVAGVDTQEARLAHESLTTFLINHATDLALDHISGLAAIAAVIPWETPYEAEVHRGYLEELSRVEKQVAQLPDAAPAAIATALDDVLIMRQFLTLWAAPDDIARSTARDRVMADRTASLAHATPGSRVALWAHNAHIAASRGSYWGGSVVVPLGLNLKARFADDLIIIGILFGSGSYQAVQRDTDNTTFDLSDVDVGEPPWGSLDAALLNASMAPASLLDLRELPPDLHEWLGAQHITRTAGALALRSDEMERKVNVMQSYDVVAFIRETTRSIPL